VVGALFRRRAAPAPEALPAQGPRALAKPAPPAAAAARRRRRVTPLPFPLGPQGTGAAPDDRAPAGEQRERRPPPLISALLSLAGLPAGAAAAATTARRPRRGAVAPVAAPPPRRLRRGGAVLPPVSRSIPAGNGRDTARLLAALVSRAPGRSTPAPAATTGPRRRRPIATGTGAAAPRRQRGAVAVLVAVTLVALIGMAALVVDMGQLYSVRDALQVATDAAALAGAQELDRTEAGLERARDRVKEYAAEHIADTSDVEISDDDIHFGHWDDLSLTYTDFGTAPENPGAVNAVRVIARRESATGNPVALVLAPVVGVSQASVNTAATAVGGGPSSECGFPMVVPDCSLDQEISAGTCDYCMIYQDNNSDNAGWTTFDESGNGGPVIADLVREACTDDSGNVAIDEATGQCMGTCRRNTVGEVVQVNNGNLMSKGQNNFCPVIQDLLRRGDKNGPARPFVVRVPVLQSTPGTCDASQFSGFKTIAGYATMEIYGAKCAHSDPGVFAPAAPCQPPPSDKYIVAALRCDQQSTAGQSGGGYFGFDARHVRLVQ
jgi:Flp pilus assembly protein TadG